MQLRFEIAGRDHEAALRARMAGDCMKGRSIDVSFRREPDFFAAGSVQGDRVQTIACMDAQAGSSLVAMATRASAPAYVNGQARRIGYLCDLRCHPSYRGGTVLARGFRFLRRLHESDALPFYTTVIYEGNERAASALVGARAGLPAYRSWGRLLTPALRLDRRLPPLSVPGVEFMHGSGSDLPAIIAFLDQRMASRQFAPVFRVQDLDGGRLAGLRAEDFVVARSGGSIVGTLALWDQSGMRQTHAEAYRGWLGALRPLIDRLRVVGGGRPLPAPGDRIPHLYFACFAAAHDDPRIGAGLLRAAYLRARQGPWHYAICGLHERDPLAGTWTCYPRIEAAGWMHVVHYPEDARAVDALDDRVPHLEAGCL